ncbi:MULTISPECIES: YunG family protein [unclassified Bradyrhizobium]|uniref:YunG family protein n=1 Tax=unclassified Bradyrhizobium TaxID=2631580 RepID=UPI002FF02BA7
MTTGCSSLIGLYHKLRSAWSAETSSQWRSDNPAAGQCSVTTLVIQDELGGEILKTQVNGAWHFYNQVNGRRVDFTMSQFDSPIGYDDLPSNRQEALDDTSMKRYELLLGRIRSGRLLSEPVAPVPGALQRASDASQNRDPSSRGG